MRLVVDRSQWLVAALAISLGGAQAATGQSDRHSKMAMDTGGMVMHANASELPRDCDAISREHDITVRANTDYADGRPGSIFGMDDHEYRVAPCSRVTVTFINEDEVRHQWMVHGLPAYLYPGGMFHLEAAGGHRVTGTFIVPSDHKTYLVHCDMAQHMEKGMKAQLQVGRGSGDLTSIPTVSAPFESDDYLRGAPGWWLLVSAAAGFVLACVGLWLSR